MLSTLFGYFAIAAVPAVILTLLYLPVCRFLYRKLRLPVFAQLYRLGLAIVLAIIAYAILFSVRPNFDPAARQLNLQLFHWIADLSQEDKVQTVIVQLIANTLMFLPLGLLLPLIFRRMRSLGATLAAVLAVSVFFEGIQYFIGRCCDIDDVAVYLVGAAIGYGIYRMFAAVRTRLSGHGFPAGENRLRPVRL